MKQTISGAQGQVDRLAADPLGLGIPWSFDPMLAAATTNIGTANRTYYYRVSGGGRVSKIGLYVQTASGNVCVSVYANTGAGRNAMPGARVATSGSVPCPVAGYAEIALDVPVQITAGDFWLAFTADNTTAIFEVVSTQGIAVQGRMAWQDTAFPSPVTATPANGSGGGGGNRAILLVGGA